MNIETLLNKTFSLKDVLTKILPWVVIIFLSYYLYNCTQELQNFKIALQEEKDRTSLLVKELHEIRGIVESLTVSYKVNTPIDPLIRISENEMTQFYIKSIGIFACGVVVFLVLSNVWPATFSFKKIIPLQMYKMIQSYTPFFQTKSTYTSPVDSSGLEWMVNIYNEKNLEILVKPLNSLDYIRASEYILSLQQQVTTITLAKPPMFPEYPVDQTLTALTHIANVLG